MTGTAADLTFPPGFLIGASTAAHQIEGNNVSSSWWTLEHRPGSAIQEPSGDAADSFHRWPDDLDLVADLGLRAYRFSIEWARIEPEPGRWSRAALAHYRRMIDGARDRGIEPVVTLHHFTEPKWSWERGSWWAPDAVARFQAYVEAVTPILEGVRWIVTINEPNMVAVMARFHRPPAAGPADDKSSDLAGLPLPAPDPTVSAALADAHHTGARHLREAVPGARVGWSIANQVVQVAPGGEELAAQYREQVEDWFLRESAGDDFVGVQSYTRTIVGPEGQVRDDPEDSRTLTGWEYFPDALEQAVRHTSDMVPGVPILVTENGIATADDERRIAYTSAALAGLRRTIDDGIDVRGYLHWSLLDNYEWGSYRPTFGLVAWDAETFDRTPKPSARWLGDVARTTGRAAR